MIKVSVMYPNKEGARFDHDYYREKHMPLVAAWMDRTIDALHGVHFDVGPGEIVALLGRNGSGRSTTAKAILLLKTADRGISAQDLDIALRTYEKLQLETARRVLGFYRARLKPRNASMAAAG